MKGRSQIRQTRIAAKTRGVTFDAQSTINRWILHMHYMKNVSIIHFNELLDMLKLEIQYNEIHRRRVLFTGPDQARGLHPGESQPPRQIQVQPAGAAGPDVMVFVTGLPNEDCQ